MPTDAAVLSPSQHVDEWLSLDEVAKRLHFPSRRAVLYFLRHNPVPVYRRTGSRRYFMRAGDLDRFMERVAVQPFPSEIARGEAERKDPPVYTEVEPPPARAPRRRRGAAK